jgi:cysteinyl-tRNA synthetase
MSKSKGGILTVSVLQEKGYDPLAYRLFCLQSHYRKPLEFTYEQLGNARAALLKLRKRTEEILKNADKAEGEEVDKQLFHEFRDRFSEAVGNDVNTAMALTVLYDVLKADTNDLTKAALIKDFDRVLSLDLGIVREKEDGEADEGFASWVEEQIALRAEAKRRRTTRKPTGSANFSRKKASR